MTGINTEYSNLISSILNVPVKSIETIFVAQDDSSSLIFLTLKKNGLVWKSISG